MYTFSLQFFYLFFFLYFIYCFHLQNILQYKPRHTPRILGRKFTLTSTAYKYLDVGIIVSFVEIAISDNQGNNIILPRAMWRAFKRRADIKRFVQSIAPSSLSVQDLVIEVVKMRDVNVVKHCIIHVYIWSHQPCSSCSNSNIASRMYTLSCASIRMSSMKNLNIL